MCAVHEIQEITGQSI